MFFLILFALYGLGSVYLMIRGWQSLEWMPELRPYGMILLILLSASFFLARAFRDHWPDSILRIFQDAGMFWLVPMLYLVMFALLCDVLRLGNALTSFYPSWVIADYPKAKFIILISGLSLVSLVCIYGYYRFVNPSVKEISVTLPKVPGGLDSMKMVMVSDLHLGTTTHKKRMQKYVKLINENNPDLVCIAGDLIDSDISSVERQSMEEEFKQIKTRYGTFAVPGNHDHFSDFRQASRFFERSGIVLLVDSVAEVASTVQMMGRDDKSRRNRKSLARLRSENPTGLPVILLDHQPVDLSEAAQNGISLQLSGHTHDGQIWPFSALVRSMYEVSHGYLRKGNTHYYVSSGLALWGPHLRIGTESEMVVVRLLFR